MRKPIWWVVGGLIVVCAAVLVYSWRANRSAPHRPVQASVPKPAPAPATPPVQNPVPGNSTPAEQPLPTLGDSDGPVRDAIAALAGQAATERLVKPDMLVRHIVVTVDNLSRKHAAVDLWPVRPVPGQFAVQGDNQHASIDPHNYERYTPYVLVVQMLDMKQLAALYFHFYPLFQQAYQNLGYPNGYFNDRLVETIDNLLETPDAQSDTALVRPNVMYQYADPMLENLSSGQKVLLRMGPQNEGIVKGKLKELRDAVANHSRGGDAARNHSTASGG